VGFVKRVREVNSRDARTFHRDHIRPSVSRSDDRVERRGAFDSAKAPAELVIRSSIPAHESALPPVVCVIPIVWPNSWQWIAIRENLASGARCCTPALKLAMIYSRLRSPGSVPPRPIVPSTCCRRK